MNQFGLTLMDEEMKIKTKDLVKQRNKFGIALLAKAKFNYLIK